MDWRLDIVVFNSDNQKRKYYYLYFTNEAAGSPEAVNEWIKGTSTAGQIKEIAS